MSQPKSPSSSSRNLYPHIIDVQPCAEQAKSTTATTWKEKHETLTNSNTSYIQQTLATDTTTVDDVSESNANNCFASGMPDSQNVVANVTITSTENVDGGDADSYQVRVRDDLHKLGHTMITSLQCFTGDAGRFQGMTPTETTSDVSDSWGVRTAAADESPLGEINGEIDMTADDLEAVARLATEVNDDATANEDFEEAYNLSDTRVKLTFDASNAADEHLKSARIAVFKMLKSHTTGLTHTLDVIPAFTLRVKEQEVVTVEDLEDNNNSPDTPDNLLLQAVNMEKDHLRCMRMASDMSLKEVNSVLRVDEVKRVGAVCITEKAVDDDDFEDIYNLPDTPDHKFSSGIKELDASIRSTRKAFDESMRKEINEDADDIGLNASLRVDPPEDYQDLKDNKNSAEQPDYSLLVGSQIFDAHLKSTHFTPNQLSKWEIDEDSDTSVEDLKKVVVPCVKPEDAAYDDVKDFCNIANHPKESALSAMKDLEQLTCTSQTDLPIQVSSMSKMISNSQAGGGVAEDIGSSRQTTENYKDNNILRALHSLQEGYAMSSGELGVANEDAKQTPHKSLQMYPSEILNRTDEAEEKTQLNERGDNDVGAMDKLLKACTDAGLPVLMGVSIVNEQEEMKPYEGDKDVGGMVKLLKSCADAEPPVLIQISKINDQHEMKSSESVCSPIGLRSGDEVCQIVCDDVRNLRLQSKVNKEGERKQLFQFDQSNPPRRIHGDWVELKSDPSDPSLVYVPARDTASKVQINTVVVFDLEPLTVFGSILDLIFLPAPAGKRVQFHITRIKRVIGRDYHASIELERGRRSDDLSFTMSAVRVGRLGLAKYNITMGSRMTAEHNIGLLKENYDHTFHTLYDVQPGRIKDYSEIATVQYCIVHRTSTWNNSFDVKLNILKKSKTGPNLMFNESKSDGKQKSKQSTNCSSSDVLLLHNKIPEKNEYNRAAMYFNDRARVTSVKNIQLVPDKDDRNIYMQCGRLNTTEFTLDYKSPMSALQAFGVMVAMLESQRYGV